MFVAMPELLEPAQQIVPRRAPVPKVCLTRFKANEQISKQVKFVSVDKAD